ncbi:AAA family ATPase [Mechercharimyces sp. CAU 1602]|uniref:AAA family ATPase n=1 Tax=Mechercharimyces sp. CAU 1602 TaxID=2973933 RepID=UPI00216223B3|nr:AAA family ATPase [Mechercharimyces sp. CAU 1602]MCS1351228.1 AAA family ATPase [Mechercharimyces sp. CAU 1602]
MISFRRLKIENFQSHVQTEIHFEDGLQVFVGPSDSGKSAILRALRWVLYNQPRGSDFIRTGCSRCRVSLTLVNGVTIMREKGTSINRYVIINESGEEQVYEGFGSSVPQEVLDAHQMLPLKVDGDWEMALQFGSQLEAPFLLSDSGSVKAKSISRISGAHVLDMALRDAVRDRQALFAEKRQQEKQVEELRQELVPYENLPELKANLERVEHLQSDIDRKKQQVDSYRKLAERRREIQAQLVTWKGVLQQLAQVDEIERKVSASDSLFLRLQQVKRLHRVWQEREYTEKRCRDVLKQVQALPKVEEMLESVSLQLRKQAGQHSLKHRWVRLQEQLDRSRYWLKETRGTVEVENSLESVHVALQRYHQLKQITPRWLQTQAERQKWKQVERQTEVLPQLLLQVSVSEEKLAVLHRLLQLREQKRDLRKRICEGEQFLTQKEEEIVRQTEEYANLLRRYGRCPTCGTEMTEGHDVLQHLR